jgi:uncharacterized membrane protein
MRRLTRHCLLDILGAWPGRGSHRGSGGQRRPAGEDEHAVKRPLMDTQHGITLVELGFEFAGTSVLVIGSAVALIRFIATLLSNRTRPMAYRGLREDIGRAILLGLEFLVAADIIRSVALEPTFQSIGVLGLLVLVRTFLSWSLEVEIEDEWPWQRARSRVAE